MTDRLAAQQFDESAGVEDWRALWGAGMVGAYFRSGSFGTGAALVHAISKLSAVANHHVDVDLRPEGVSVRLFTHEPRRLTNADVELAREISAAARELGATADPTAVQHVQIAIDALVIAEVRPFWQAVLGCEPDGDAAVLDPLRRGPSVWFQQMDAARPQRNRIHIDLYVPRDQGEARVAAALAAGGHIVSDAHAPLWWTLADPEGNEVDVAIWG
ncbi:MAG TPA: VOC family protein [Micromonosporaceae bacterium]|jgi:4a-hydroxytetrahydrobiopterin dehydratase|nr:VOC family protein [Micromonosporaceae bacterium]